MENFVDNGVECSEFRPNHSKLLIMIVNNHEKCQFVKTRSALDSYAVKTDSNTTVIRNCKHLTGIPSQ